ncbi:MAG: MarR family transcriptional regulator [Chloroflexota bacterium]
MANLPFDGSFWVNIDRVLRHLDGVYSRAIEELDLDVIEAYILWSLNEQDGQRPSDLARAVGRAVTSFTPILDKLERKALIERRSNSADRRSVRIHLTPTGEKLSRQVAALFQATDTVIKQYIGADELSSFLRVVLVLQHISADT